MGEEQNTGGVTQLEDAKIIDLYFARKEQAITETDKAYGRRLFSLSERILSSREDAEENVSDTYMRTWEAIPPQRPGCFPAFLQKICRHLALDRLDWRKAVRRNGEVVALTREMEQCIPDHCMERRIEGREIGRILDGFLGSLPPESRLIFLRRYLYGDTVAEIAGRYGITESKVKMQLHRTRGKLRIHLEKEGIKV